uniref:Uncharacterized protein n=1 Tax=Plectus sambesii TaxID=2011161 RepID=A0A914ULM8_9BILA
MRRLLLLGSLSILLLTTTEATSPVQECKTPASISLMRGFPVAYVTYVGDRGICELRFATNVHRSSNNVFYSLKTCIETCCPESCRPTCCYGYMEK